MVHNSCILKILAVGVLCWMLGTLFLASYRVGEVPNPFSPQPLPKAQHQDYPSQHQQQQQNQQQPHQQQQRLKMNTNDTFSACLLVMDDNHWLV